MDAKFPNLILLHYNIIIHSDIIAVVYEKVIPWVILTAEEGTYDKRGVFLSSYMYMRQLAPTIFKILSTFFYHTFKTVATMKLRTATLKR